MNRQNFLKKILGKKLYYLGIMAIGTVGLLLLTLLLSLLGLVDSSLTGYPILILHILIILVYITGLSNKHSILFKTESYNELIIWGVMTIMTAAKIISNQKIIFDVCWAILAVILYLQISSNWKSKPRKFIAIFDRVLVKKTNNDVNRRRRNKNERNPSKLDTY